MPGVQAPLAALHPLSPTCPVRLIGICWTESLHARGLGLLKWLPEVPPGRKMSRRHRKGKQRAADLSEELSVRRALGQRQS